MKSAHFLFTLPSFCFSSLCLPPPFSLLLPLSFLSCSNVPLYSETRFFHCIFMALVSPPTPLPLLTHTSHCLCVFPWLSPTFSLSSFLLYLRFQLFFPLSETSVSLLSLSTLFAITHYPLLVSSFFPLSLSYFYSILCPLFFCISKIRPYRNH